MGAGASFESGLGLEEEQYFCHACRRVLTLDGPRHDMTCPHCDSTFLEEVGGIRQSELLPGRRGGRPYQNIFGEAGGSLSAEQTRRISSAATMLRLLETQLREELEQLQFAFENSHIRMGDGSRIDQGAAQQPVKPKLSKIMLGKCLECVLDVDTVCSQPSCPICSEDFTVSSEETKLPCGHLFHRPCVLPWLQQKQNCPICRSQLSDEIPSLPELEKLSLKHLSSWLALMQQQDGATVTTTGAAAEQTLQKEEDEEHANTNHSESKAENIGTEFRADNNRIALAKKLSEALLQYQEDLEQAQRQEQQRQVSAATAQRARLQNLDDHISEYLSHNQWRGNAATLRTESMPTLLTRTASNESNQAISAALRRGFHSQTAGPSSTVLNSSFSISGSTPLLDGQHLHHHIRLVDDDSDNEAGDSDGNSTPPGMEGAYQRAQQQHLARFGVGGISTTTSSMPHPFSGFHSAGSAGLLSTAGTRPQRPYDPSEDAMRAFVQALHPERAENIHLREPLRNEERSIAASPSAGGHARVRFADTYEDEAPQSAPSSATEQYNVNTTVSGDGNSSGSNAGERLGRINQRVSAIDRYMTLSAPQLFGTSSSPTSSSSGTTGSSQQPLGATFQVRASGTGSYTTVAVNAAGPDTATVATID